MLSAMEVIIAQRLSYGFKSQQVHLSSHDDINLPGAPIVWLRQNYFTHGLAIPRLVGHYQMGLFSSPLLCTCKCLFLRNLLPAKILTFTVSATCYWRTACSTERVHEGAAKRNHTKEQ